MNALICPKCGTRFKIDEQDYESILKQIKNNEFKKEIEIIEKRYISEKESALKLQEAENKAKVNEELSKLNEEVSKLKNEKDTIEKTMDIEVKSKVAESNLKYNEEISKLKLEISKLESELKDKDNEKEIEITKITNELDKSINDLKNKIDINDKEYELKEKNLIQKYLFELKEKDEQIEYYKNMKARQSTKMIGESLEQHCNAEFSKVRPIFSNKTYFEKDNDSRTGSKGDFIFRDFDEDGNEIVSIMFEMKNEADETATKHKNEDFFKELDKDRKEKNCEYAVLVTLLEADNETYNYGIVDVSYKYEKMYVVRPQFFIPIITLLRNASLKSISYKKQLIEMQNQNIDITNFENNINAFKDSFSRNYRLASEKFKKAIEEIDKTIDHLQKTKESLLSSENNLRIANNKAEDLSIKKLVKDNETMAKRFNDLNKTKNISVEEYVTEEEFI